MYIHVRPGDAPILLTIPHDGGIKLPNASVRRSRSLRDLGTLPLGLEIASSLSALGEPPTVIWCSLHRSHIDLNRSLELEPFAPGFKETYEEFFSLLDSTLERLLNRHAHVTLIDIHGATIVNQNGHWDMVLGTNQHRCCPRGNDRQLAKHLATQHNSVLGRPYDVGFSPDSSRGMDGRYSGGWIVQRGRKWAPNGLESIQIEFNRHLREPHMTDELARHLASALAQLS